MKKNTRKITFKLLAFAVSSLIFVGCSSKEDNKLTILTLDINPSIELVINKEGNIDSINAVNEDAKNVLKDVDVINDSLDEGISEIIEEAIEKGYITNVKENNILISIDGATVDETISIRNTTKNAIDKTLDEKAIPVNIAIQEFDVTNEMINKAMQDEISVGKLYAIEKINDSGVTKIENSKNTLVSDIIHFGSQAQIFNDDKDDINDDKDDINDDKDDINDDKDDINDDKDDINDDKDDINDDKDDINDDKDDINDDKDDINDDINDDKDDINDDKDDIDDDKDDIDDNKKVSQPNNTSVKPNTQQYIPVNNDDDDDDDDDNDDNDNDNDDDDDDDNDD